MENVLVTGGGGFLGKAIVKRLMEKKLNVSSFSRKAYAGLDEMGVRQIKGDLGDIESVTRAVRGMDTVFHVAAKPGIWGKYKDFYHTNVTGTRNILSACRHNQVAGLIYTSSPSVVFDESEMENQDESAPYPSRYLAPYPETKAMAEKQVIKAAEQGLPCIILRPHLIWGPEDNHLVPGIIGRASRLKKIGRTDDLVDTIYVDNAAHAHILAAIALEKNPGLSGNVYFISQDEPVSKWAMADAFLEAAGLPPVKGHISAQTAYAAGCLFEFAYKLLGIKRDPPLTRFAARELATSHWFNISRAKKDLGYVPEVSIKEGLERLKEWMKEPDIS